MELFLLVLVALCGSVQAKPSDGRWIFPDELDALTEKPKKNSFDFFQPNNVSSSNLERRPYGRGTSETTPPPDLRPNGRATSETTPSPDVLFHIPNCKCRYPPQYNPVCGSDGLSYVNAQMLKCARLCGSDVIVARMGTCRGRFSVDK